MVDPAVGTRCGVGRGAWGVGRGAWGVGRGIVTACGCGAAVPVRGGPQSLDRLAAKSRWNLLFIICCQIERSSSSLSSSKANG